MAIPIAIFTRLVVVLHILTPEYLPTLDYVIVNGSVNYNALRHVGRTLIETSRMHMLAILHQTMAGNYSLLERHERTIARIIEFNDPRRAIRQWPEWRFRITQSKKPHRQETSRNSTEEGNALVFDTEGALGHLSHSSASRSRRPQTRAASQANQSVPPLPVADDSRLRQYSSHSCAPQSRRPQTRTAPQANQSVPPLPEPDDRRLRQYSSRSCALQSRRPQTRTAPQANQSVPPLPEPDNRRRRLRQLSSKAKFVPQPSTSFGNSPQELGNRSREKPRHAPRCNTCAKNMQGLSLLDKRTWSKIREIINRLDRSQIRDFIKEINKWDKKIFNSVQSHAIPDHEIVDALVKSLQRYHLSGKTTCVLCFLIPVFRRIRRPDLANQIEEIQSRLN